MFLRSVLQMYLICFVKFHLWIYYRNHLLMISKSIMMVAMILLNKSEIFKVISIIEAASIALFSIHMH